jgi:PAS domain S-box-containing protein
MLPSAPTFESERATILLVDDRDANLITLQAVLERPEYHFVLAHSGEEALVAALRHDPAVVLLDVAMPTLDGFQTASLIRQRPSARHLPIIFVTGIMSDIEHVFRGYEAGAVDYLTKPFDPNAVRAKVAVFVELWRNRRAIERAAAAEKQLADALAASERRFAHLADMGFIGVFEQTRDGAITAANAAFLEMIGRSAVEVEAGRVTSHEHTPAECEAADEHVWKTLATTGVCKTYEKDFVRKDGRRLTALVGGVGNDTRFVGCALDVTALKEVAHERARNVRELQDCIRARDDFLSLASHELRSPLTPLMLRLDGLLGRVGSAGAACDAGALAEELRAMKRVATRVTQLVDNLLEASRMTVGRIPLQIEQLDLSLVVRDVIDRMRPELTRGGCELTLQAEKPVVGRWDRTRLEQIVGNLVSNAVKYGARAPIAIRVGWVGNAACFEIQDHGIGIPHEQHARIFERFERAAPARHYGGFGIGLWIVHQLVEAHGGRVRVESDPGDGACFTVELPPASAMREPDDSPYRFERTR